MNNTINGTSRRTPFKIPNMTKAKAIRDTIRRINEITDRAADDWLHTSLQNKPIPSHPFVVKPMIQNRAETTVIIVAIIIKIRPDIRISFFRRY